MKKTILALFICSTLLCTACKKEKENLFPEPVEPTIEEIKKSKLDAAKISMTNIKKTADLYYLESQLDVNYAPSDIIIDFSDSATIPENFVLSGAVPTAGTIVIKQDGDIIFTNIAFDNVVCNFENTNVVCK